MNKEVTLQTLPIVIGVSAALLVALTITAIATAGFVERMVRKYNLGMYQELALFMTIAFLDSLALVGVLSLALQRILD